MEQNLQKTLLTVKMHPQFSVKKEHKKKLP